MAEPSFINAFDDLGPIRFAKLSGDLLASRCPGFLLGGVGPDGGIDGEIDNNIGTWRPLTTSPLLNEAIQPDRLVVFQFKHIATARVGQIKARDELLKYFKCRPRKKCELHSDLITQKRPDVYILVTNVETNSKFRAKFMNLCEIENSRIKHYQIIGLDDLVAWVTTEPEIRHLHFPSIFGEPRFNLRIQLSFAWTAFSLPGHPPDPSSIREVLEVSIQNIGVAASYVSSVVFVVLIQNELAYLNMFNISDPVMAYNPQVGAAIEPGNALGYRFPLDEFRRHLTKLGNGTLPVEVLVSDRIGNRYRAAIPEDLKNAILQRI